MLLPRLRLAIVSPAFLPASGPVNHEPHPDQGRNPLQCSQCHVAFTCHEPAQRALGDALADKRLKKGDLVLLASVGAGFTVGAMLVRWAY